jgi:hypothetical protein
MLIPKLIKLAEEVPGAPLKWLREFIFHTLNTPGVIAYADIHEGEYRGFIYANISEWNGDKCVFIQACVLKPCKEERYIGFELLTKIKLFAKEKNLTQIYFITQRNPEGFIRKYHFENAGNILKLDLTKGDK